MERVVQTVVESQISAHTHTVISPVTVSSMVEVPGISPAHSQGREWGNLCWLIGGFSCLHFFSDQTLHFIYEAEAAATIKIHSWLTDIPSISVHNWNRVASFKKCCMYSLKYFAVAAVSVAGKLIPKENFSSALVTSTVCMSGMQLRGFCPLDVLFTLSPEAFIWEDNQLC